MIDWPPLSVALVRDSRLGDGGEVHWLAPDTHGSSHAAWASTLRSRKVCILSPTGQSGVGAVRSVLPAGCVLLAGAVFPGLSNLRMVPFWVNLRFVSP
ncbi:hypothetical protein AAFF_G00263450 [Aldrovandia affinis]|uniref:Uncharacterized protein n=1 Tax=Aldrovandia affinis TaxID=143900 RepID=A0AAD7WSY5_9TELE|nr:hypothetical protein AAFF_G00263450 [Aldrovandia affinis]